MLICGIKFGHDGTVALIEGDTLVFSVEMEKLNNGIRHCPLFDLEAVFSILSGYGHSIADIDHFVIDGWHPGKDVFKWRDKAIRLPRAGYIQTPLDRDLLEFTQGRHEEFSYSSYPHYAGHAIGAYCTSPFAPDQESSFILSWDGGMVPYLYYFDAARDAIENLGPLFSVVGDLYAEMAAGLGPFSANPSQWETLGTPGKIMAYVAHGREQEDLLSQLREFASTLPGLNDATLRQIYPANLDFLHRVKDTPLFKAADGDNVIASYHGFIERRLLESLEAKTKEFSGYARNLCYAGGCALNIKWNQAIRETGLFHEMWIPPFPNDAGSALGTACCAMLTQARVKTLKWSVYSGPEFQLNQTDNGWEARECSLRELAELIHRSDEPVLFLGGRAELGPRALGNRSILAPATRGSMKDILNEVKGREGYRPVAPICLQSHAPEIFNPGVADPYMLYDHQVRDAWKEKIPAIQHLDGTARLQTVNANEHPQVFELLTQYHGLSGVPLLCNTSANFHHKGFFPDLYSATSWGKVNYVWSNGRLFSKRERVTFRAE